MGEDVVELPRDADPLLTGPSACLVLATALRREGPVFDLFEVRTPAPGRLAEDETRDEPAGEPQGSDEVADVPPAKENAHRQEPADDRDDRHNSRSAVSRVRDRVQRHPHGNRAQPARIGQKVVRERRDHRPHQGGDGMPPADQQGGGARQKQGVPQGVQPLDSGEERGAHDEPGRNRERQSRVHDGRKRRSSTAMECHRKTLWRLPR